MSAGDEFYLSLAERLTDSEPAFPDDLERAISIYRMLLAQSSPRMRRPTWITAKVGMSHALTSLAVVEIDHGRYQDAVELLSSAAVGYEESLSVLDQTSDVASLIWIKSALGYTLRRLGELQPSSEALEKAVLSCRYALSLMTAEDQSSLKATSLGRLANALEALAERELGTARIKEAIAAYNDALNLTSRRENPQSWASFQNDLGGALAILGERDMNASALNDSARAYHQALLEYTREKAPLKWAMVKHNLAATLWALGTTRGRLRNVEKAISCFLEALEERTSDKRPFEWAMTQHSLGVALLGEGRITEDENKFKAACVALECSLTVNTKQANIVKWIESSLSLANAKGELGKLTSDLVLLEQAIGIHRGVAQELALINLPRLRSLTQMSLAENLLRRGKGMSDSAELREAVQTCRFLVESLAFKEEPFQRAASAFQLSRALLDLSASTEEPELLQEAAHILDDVWAELHKQGRLRKRERVLAQKQLTEEKLREYGEQAVENDQKNVRMWTFDIALSVLLHFLGSNWVEEYLFKNGPLKPPPRSVDPLRQFVIGREGYALAEMLFNLQHETGFEGIRERLIAGNIESVISELEAARFLRMYGESFRFVEPTGRKGFDYDLEVFRPGLNIQCEVKAKAEGAVSFDSIYASLKKARTQLPQNALGMIFVRTPASEADEEILSTKAAFDEASKQLFRSSMRVVGTVLLTQKIIFDPRGTSGSLLLFSCNFNSAHGLQMQMLSDIELSRSWHFLATLLGYPSQGEADRLRLPPR